MNNFFEELEMFSRFATKLDDITQKTINRGQLIREILKQSKSKTISVEGQIAIFMCVNNGVFDNISLDKINKIQTEIVYLMENKFPDIINTIKSNEKLSKVQIDSFLEKAKEIAKKFKDEE